jgi:hypothetical protein
MEYKEISEIPFTKEIAIVINVSTKYVSTLALLSIKKHTDLPVLLIDCHAPNDDGSYDYFSKLLNQVDFGLLQLPLKSHGSTLDYIFRNIKSDRVLLLDSDAEILSGDVVSFFLKESRKETYFGAGFKHEFRRIEYENGGYKNGLYCERMWLPLCVLDVKKVTEALDANKSFNVKTLFSNKPTFQRVARKFHKRYKYPYFRTHFSFLSRVFGFRFLNFDVEWIFCDTGALLFQYLCYSKQYDYSGITENSYPDYAIHALGVTRGILSDDSEVARFETYKTFISKINEVYLIDVRGI